MCNLGHVKYYFNFHYYCSIITATTITTTYTTITVATKTMDHKIKPNLLFAQHTRQNLQLFGLIKSTSLGVSSMFSLVFRDSTFQGTDSNETPFHVIIITGIKLGKHNT